MNEPLSDGSPRDVRAANAWAWKRLIGRGCSGRSSDEGRSENEVSGRVIDAYPRPGLGIWLLVLIGRERVEIPLSGAKLA